MTFTEHLLDLRRRIQSSLWLFLAAALGSYFFSDFFIRFLLAPAKAVQWIFLSPGEYFVATIKVSLLGGFFIAFPYILFQLLAFIYPALTPVERRYCFPLVAVGILWTGMVFVVGYLWILPLSLRFFLTSGLSGAVPSLSVGAYLTFATTLFFLTALATQFPLVLLFMTKVGLFSVAALKTYRPHAFLFNLVLAAILTPGQEIFVMLGLSFLLHFFYELGLILSTVLGAKA